MSDAPYFERHVFFCMNKREDGRNSCGDHGAEAAQKHCKRRIKELDMNGAGKIRINQAGCMDRCEEGPLLVIYPEATWYTYVDTSDIDEVSLQRPAPRLLLPLKRCTRFQPQSSLLRHRYNPAPHCR